MSKIPEGTQFIEAGCGEKGFRKFEKGCWWFFEDFWRPVDWKMGVLTLVTQDPRYVPPVTLWNGEGLPPVGTVCELKSGEGDWGRGVICYASRNVIVWDWEGEPPINGLCTAYAHSVKLRPIRTAKQIATEEREKAISDMTALSPLLDKGWSRRVCEAVYDAGYRKHEAAQ